MGDSLRKERFIIRDALLSIECDEVWEDGVGVQPILGTPKKTRQDSVSYAATISALS